MNTETRTFPDGRTFISSDLFTVGDYGGSGSVGAGNIRALEAQHKGTIEEIGSTEWRIGSMIGGPGNHWKDYEPDPATTLIVVLWPYSTRQAWVIDNEETKETIAALENYPAIDDEEISNVEIEWENEAWGSWLRSDLLRECSKTIEDFDDTADQLTPDELFACYRVAMESTNTYPVPEYNGVHVDVQRIVEAFADNVQTAVKEKSE